MTIQTDSFTAIPILDYAASTSATTKPAFLAELRNALVNVGFFYLVNAPIAPNIREDLVKKCKALFELPLEKKLEIEMVNSKHFLGYSRLGAEITARKQDFREQFDVRFSGTFECRRRWLVLTDAGIVCDRATRAWSG
jgi:isopenicillin N synthase-like dioxygenase